MSSTDPSPIPPPQGGPQNLWVSVPAGFRVTVTDTQTPGRFSQTLAQWCEQHGGYEGYVSFFSGARYPLSLAPFAHLDPARAYVMIDLYSRMPSSQWEENATKPPVPFTPAMIYSRPLLPDDIRTPPTPMGKHRGTVRVLPPALVFTIGPNGGINEEPSPDSATLAAYRDALGGDTGVVMDGYLGQTHPLSFAIYRHMNPETTYLGVQVDFTPEGHAEAVEERRKVHFDHARVPGAANPTGDDTNGGATKGEGAA